MASKTSAGVKAVGADVGGAAVDLLLDAGDANLEELVKIGGKNGEKFDSLHEWLASASCASSRTRRLNSSQLNSRLMKFLGSAKSSRIPPEISHSPREHKYSCNCQLLKRY